MNGRVSFLLFLRTKSIRVTRKNLQMLKSNWIIPLEGKLIELPVLLKGHSWPSHCRKQWWNTLLHWQFAADASTVSALHSECVRRMGCSAPQHTELRDKLVSGIPFQHTSKLFMPSLVERTWRHVPKLSHLNINKKLTLWCKWCKNISLIY